MSDRRPTLGVNLAYDHDSGLYAGGSVIAVNTESHGVKVLGNVEYLGYVLRTKSGYSWDIGASHQSYTSYKFKERTVGYSEIYTGMITEHFSSRLYYTSNYFESGIKTLYAEFGANYRPAPDWRLFWRLGVLTPVGGAHPPGGRRERYNVAAGIATQLPNCELSLSWTWAAPDVVYPNGQKLERDAIVVGATYFF